MTAPTHSSNLTPAVVSPAANSLAPGRNKRLQVDLKDLLQGSSEIEIVHQDEVYTLRLTRNNKLILTK
jgi:hemin uptake protein HemP